MVRFIFASALALATALAALGGCDGAGGGTGTATAAATGTAVAPSAATAAPPSLPAKPGIYVEGKDGSVAASSAPIPASGSISFILYLESPPPGGKLRARFWSSSLMGGVGYNLTTRPIPDGVFEPAATPIDANPAMFRAHYDGSPPPPGHYLLYYFTDASAPGEPEWHSANFQFASELEFR